MKLIRSNLTALGLIPLVTGVNVPAADATSSIARPSPRPEVRRPLRDFSPDEREARFKEMEQRFGPAPFTFDELRTMAPEERQTKMRQWREGRFGFTPEERQKRRLQIRQRLTRQIAELQKAKAAGKISEEERRQLERLELLASRFDRLGKPPVNAAVSSNSSTIKSPK
jgi:hypothetical protein